MLGARSGAVRAHPTRTAALTAHERQIAELAATRIRNRATLAGALASRGGTG
ncbi:hypothetical protein [Rhodococcus rhodochrous]|uniref:Uncharacterized protein n=1 Tax=Rhodococcus rhodochrous TaxID=1829 RepID=A0AA46WS08_RHORH|nr:hypothetical protein [Rhodococcus rhodochrous]UZF43309.1 hypothetical protein KUM34_015475 [Rhodococcus rhodochrous]